MKGPWEERGQHHPRGPLRVGQRPEDTGLGELGEQLPLRGALLNCLILYDM